MNHGIEPTHMQEMRKRQWLRLFVEERIVDIQFVFMYFLHKVYNFFSVLNSIKKFIISHRKYTAIVLLALTVFAIMML